VQWARDGVIAPSPLVGEGSIEVSKAMKGEGLLSHPPLTPSSALKLRVALSREGRGHDNYDLACGTNPAERPGMTHVIRAKEALVRLRNCMPSGSLRAGFPA
jgi:hypothetical protein